MDNKELYTLFYSEHNDIPVYSAPWWLDAVCGKDNWDVILIKDKNEKIIATFPYYLKKEKFGLKNLTMPLLTQKLGPYIVYDSNKISEMKKIGYEHEIYSKIIEQLPKVDMFNVNFDQRYKNWLPFYWRGFKQTTRYSYKIFNLKDLPFVFSNIAKYKRQKIQKAENNLFVKDDMSVEEFYEYFAESVKTRGEKVSYSLEFIKNLVNAVYKHNAGKIYYCTDSENNIHAVAFIVWDKKCAYYLSAMRKSDFNTSGGNEFLVWHIIKEVSSFVDEFDFEGSMIKGVEESYRYYGTTQTEYYNISKINNPLIILGRDAFAVFRGIKKKFNKR